MAKVSLSKSGLHKERENLRLYAKVLPSLDLKRRQLMGEHKRAEHALAALVAQFADALIANVSERIPMLATSSVDIGGIVAVNEIRRGTENVVGVRIPIFLGIDFEIAPYSLLGKPQWVDLVVERIREFAGLTVEIEIAKERLATLQKAVRKITQRVNLFEKILIPTAEKNIKKIQIYLSDAERAAVIQSKLSKAKRKAAGTDFYDQMGGAP